jgi:hypothetical protein
MKSLFLLLFITVCIPSVFAQPKPSRQAASSILLADKADLDSGSFRGYATLSLSQTRPRLGERFTADIRFTNRSGGDYFYNPFFNRLVPLPARLAIFDSSKKYLGDLLTWEGGSQKAVSSGDWQFIPGDCYVGTPIADLTAGYVPGTEFGVMSHLLPPGEYHLQVIYLKAFIAANPAATVRDPSEELRFDLTDFYKNFDRGELFRSNVVKVTFGVQDRAALRDDEKPTAGH